VQVLGPVCVIGGTLEQLEDHPPKLTPAWAGAVKVILLFKG
jgi:hypothetical protein